MNCDSSVYKSEVKIQTKMSNLKLGGESIFGEHAYVVGVISSYWVVSISMVYLNKVMLSNTYASISAPLFVTWYQVMDQPYSMSKSD